MRASSSPSLSTRSPLSALRWLVLAIMASLLSACGYNDFQTKDEAVKAAWGEVINQYQRRADLIPNLVNTVKGYASHERETLEAETRARAAATSIQVSFRDLQSQLDGTENRITVARQRYIAAVQQYNVLARSFPTNLTAMIFKYPVKPSFTVENEKAISTPPAVKF
ncbi:MAG: LemA family protein [Cupriavidus sp.]|nr:LemA family protein [Cupriavidus sp.]